VAGVAELAVGVQERAAVVVSIADLAGHGADDGDELAGRVRPRLLDRAIDDAFPFRAAPVQVGDDQVGWRGPWQQAADAAAALMDRKVRGKAVLEVSS